MQSFEYKQNSSTLVFGKPVTDAIKSLISDNNNKDVWIIASNRHDELVDAIDSLSGITVRQHFSRVLQHVPEDQVQKARHAVAKTNPDVILAIGGGSAIGLAKAVVLKHNLPLWAIPTTYSGSEMTNIYGITTGGKKVVGRHDAVHPEIVIYDPDLTATMSVRFAAKSAINSLSHAVEALYSVHGNPFTYQHALRAYQLILSGLKDLGDVEELTPEINETLLLGASFAGKVLCETEMALHHRLAHLLGGNYGLDHASVHTVLLPYVLNYQWASLSDEVRADVESVTQSVRPDSYLIRLFQKLSVPANLAAIGFDLSFAKDVAHDLVSMDFSNPAPLTPNKIQALIKQAYAGTLPD